MGGDILAAADAPLEGQKPAVVWFTGLSGSGKPTIANLVEERLTAEGRHAYLIDGDNLRHDLSRTWASPRPPASRISVAPPRSRE